MGGGMQVSGVGWRRGGYGVEVRNLGSGDAGGYFCISFLEKHGFRLLRLIGTLCASRIRPLRRQSSRGYHVDRYFLLPRISQRLHQYSMQKFSLAEQINRPLLLAAEFSSSKQPFY